MKPFSSFISQVYRYLCLKYSKKAFTYCWTRLEGICEGYHPCDTVYISVAMSFVVNDLVKLTGVVHRKLDWFIKTWKIQFTFMSGSGYFISILGEK